MIINLSQQMQKIEKRIAIPYIVFFELVLICRMVSIYSTLPTKIDSLFTLIIMLLSGVYFICHFLPIFIEKKQRRIEYWLIAFIGILFLTKFINHTYAFSENIKLIIWQCIFFFSVYEVGRSNDKSVFKAFEYVLLIVWTALVIVGLYLFFARISFSKPVESLYYGMRIGFFENRLYGVFVEPNYACTISLVCILVGVRNFINTNSKWLKVVCAMVIFLQFSYVALSGSRSGVIQLISMVIFGMFFTIWFFQKNTSKAVIKKVVQAVLVSFFCGAIVFGGLQLIEKGYIATANSVNIEVPKVLDNKENEILGNKKITTKRPDVEGKDDISNSRFALWQSAIDLMKLNPIFGTSPKGFADIAKDKLPQSHIAKTAQTPHSFFFYLLAATGISGTIVFLIFLLSKMFNSAKLLFSVRIKNYMDFVLDNQIVLVILISGLLITEVILTRRFATVIFWLYLGKIQYRTDMENDLIRGNEQ